MSEFPEPAPFVLSDEARDELIAVVAKAGYSARVAAF